MEPTFPLDIFLYIIDLLAAGDDRDSIRSLQILSQACKFMVPLCRKHLFSSLLLGCDSSSERFGNLLSKNPDIARYVRSLCYRVDNPISEHELNILDILKERSSLRWIVLSSPSMDWNSFPESIRSSLVSLIHLPTVTYLDIDSFKGFPATILSSCSNLIDLRLAELDFVHPEINQVISRSKILTPISLSMKTKTPGIADFLTSAGLHGGGPIINFSRLQKAWFEVEFRGDIKQVYKLIMATTRLEYINITMNRPVELRGLARSLEINAYRTLKYLQLSIPVVGDDYDPLCGLCRELGFMAGNNILEELGLESVAVGGACRTESEDWSTFDSILTKSGAFPILRLVSVEISWNSLANGRDLENEVDTLERFKEVKFPRLVESKAVAFDLSAKIHCYACQVW